MTKDSFSALKQQADEQASKYARCGRSIRVREQLWLLLWEMRHVLFRAKEIRGYMNFAPSGQYETGEEFLEEVLQEAIPQALESYSRAYTDAPDLPPFMSFFNQFYFRKVHSAYGDIQDKIPHDHIVVQKPAIPVYLMPKEESVIPDAFLKEKMERRVLEKICVDGKTWIKTKMKGHGRTVYVLETDVEYHERASTVDIDSVTEPRSYEMADDHIMASDIYDNYIVTLLSLVEQMYSRTCLRDDKGLSRKYCFKLLYTETLLDKLKQIYNAVGDVRTAREREALSVTELDLLDYLLTRRCRSFTSIAVTPMHAKRDYDYLDSDSADEIQLPISNIIYTHFLLDVKGIDRKPESIAPSFSKYRSEFRKQYDLICEAEIT